MTSPGHRIRIVVPVYNSGPALTKCIDALLTAISFHDSWELIVVNNGRSPGLAVTLSGYPLTILNRDEIPSAAYARNEGAKGFTGDILIFIDSDVVCEPNCIRELIEPLKSGKYDATIGNYSRNLRGLTFSQKYKQLYINHVYGRADTQIKNDFWTAICAVKTEVFNRLGGFNISFRGANGEDQEFGIRMTQNGFSVLSVKTANGQHLNPYGVMNIIRNDLKKGLIAVKNSLENSVPFHDNRHSRMSDICAVFFSVTLMTFTLASFINVNMLLPALFSLALWIYFRGDLMMTFIRNGGVFFFPGALLMMYCLDIVRFICVAVGITTNKMHKLIHYKLSQG